MNEDYLNNNGENCCRSSGAYSRGAGFIVRKIGYLKEGQGKMYSKWGHAHSG